jgi:hypothetical protein
MQRRLDLGPHLVDRRLVAETADVHAADDGVLGQDVDRVVVVLDGPRAGRAEEGSDAEDDDGDDLGTATETRPRESTLA